ncbi:MAG: ANTAR domain-containing protein, partial [Pseudonocardiaceae bacterium]
MGVLDLYRDQPGPLTDAELAGALLCTDVALWALLGRRAGTDPDLAPSQWGLDLHQVDIHQATGMVMSQLGISAESALETLCAFALSQGRPLDEVARQVVTRRLRFPVEDQ